MSLKKKLNLAPDEQAIEIIRPSLFIFFWHFFFALSVLLLVAFFSFWLLAQGIIGSVIISIGFVFSIMIMVRAWFLNRKNYWIITTQRLFDIEKKGIFSETISNTILENVKDIFISKKGFASRFFDYGDLNLEIYNDAYALSLVGVRYPQRIVDRLTTILTNVAGHRLEVSGQVIMKNFLKDMAKLTKGDLIELKNILDNRIQTISLIDRTENK